MHQPLLDFRPGAFGGRNLCAAIGAQRSANGLSRLMNCKGSSAASNLKRLERGNNGQQCGDLGQACTPDFGAFLGTPHVQSGETFYIQPGTAIGGCVAKID
jgi:hypothetical protein